jgi:hypothetical protein
MKLQSLTSNNLHKVALQIKSFTTILTLQNSLLKDFFFIIFDNTFRKCISRIKNMYRLQYHFSAPNILLFVYQIR